MTVQIVGAGLAGSEAAWQIAQAGIPVLLHEMRPHTPTKAHKTSLFAELVCSNSFRGASLTNAVGLLKEELKLWNSLIMQAALEAEVPAGGALAVDRTVFSKYVHEAIHGHPLITVSNQEVHTLPVAEAEAPLIIASGPLTSKSLSKSIERLTGEESLAFFDAISPIVVGASLDTSVCFRQSRYDKGDGDDYLNIPLSEDAYYRFVEEIDAAPKYTGNEAVESDSPEKLVPFEGCMPIEDMIARGRDTLLFGPMKPVGLRDPRTGKRPFAVIQLRQDDKEGKLWNIVGFQTRTKRQQQLEILRSLPGLQEAEFVRTGSFHRNTFIQSPKLLGPHLEYRGIPGLFFAGQITGTEGYVESTAGGLIAGINAVRKIKKLPLFVPPSNTAIGGLLHYISDPTRKDFQPMNISYGIMPSYLSMDNRDARGKKIPKKDRRLKAAQTALDHTKELVNQYLEPNTNLDYEKEVNSQ